MWAHNIQHSCFLSCTLDKAVSLLTETGLQFEKLQSFLWKQAAEKQNAFSVEVAWTEYEASCRLPAFQGLMHSLTVKGLS